MRVNSGFFNFLESMSKRDAYSYAVFPKNDVVGIVAETAAQLSAVAPATGFLDLARRITETRAAPVLVGFGDGRRGNNFIEFGWIISPRGGMDPMQKNQLALVSVPAWKRVLNLRASVGWIDRHGDPEVDESFDLSISVPPTLDAFDSLFREDAQVTLGPSIRDNEMDTDIYVRAGKETKVLIPGSRLWGGFLSSRERLAGPVGLRRFEFLLLALVFAERPAVVRPFDFPTVFLLRRRRV